MPPQYYVALVIQFTAEIRGFDDRRHIILFTTYHRFVTVESRLRISGLGPDAEAVNPDVRLAVAFVLCLLL